MKFFTNKIPTNSKASFSDLIEKMAAGKKQVKTASAEAKIAEKTEPANDENEMRHDVHGPEGSPADQNGEPEEDGEQKVVEAQLARPTPTPAARPAVRPQAPAAKPGVPGIAQKPMAPKPSVPGAKPMAPGAAAPKPAMPSAKPTTPGLPGAKPSAGSPAAPSSNTAAKGLTPKAKPAAPGMTGAKPTAPGARPSAPSPAAARPAPALASSKKEAVVAQADCGCETKVAEGQAAQDNGSDGEEKNKGKFPEPDREQMYKQEPQEDGKAQTEKEAAASPEFIRIANLTPKAKSWLKRYWGMLYPSDYADSMVQDK